MVTAEHLWINSETLFNQAGDLSEEANDEVAKNFYALFLAGGGGAHLWSLSRAQTPHQILSLLHEDESLLRTSVIRLKELVALDHIYMVTTSEYIDFIYRELPEIPRQNIICEPSSKDSGPATALGIKIIEQRDPNAVVAILTADHVITHADEFLEILCAAKKIAQTTDSIVTLGNLPDYPATTFGYIKRGEKLGEIDNHEYFEAVEFKEKPDIETARRFIDEGIYDWNSGMFIWSAKRALEEFAHQQPEMYRLIHHLSHIEYTKNPHEFVSLWEKMPEISLDYALMEGAHRMIVIPMDVGMVDIGNLTALFGLNHPDTYEDEESSDAMPAPCRVMVNEDGKMLAVVGVEDIIIVEDEDAFFVCHKDAAHEVKSIVETLREAQRNKFL